jgi:hypothetical protein
MAAGAVGDNGSLKRFVGIVAINTLHVFVRACQKLVVLLMVPDKALAGRNLVLIASDVTRPTRSR